MSSQMLRMSGRDGEEVTSLGWKMPDRHMADNKPPIWSVNIVVRR